MAASSAKALLSELFSEIRVEFRVGTSFSRVETRQDERHFFRYFCSLFFRIFQNSRKRKSRKFQKFVIFAIFASSEMFEKLGNYQNISEIRKTAISETRKNENFGKKRLTQGLIIGLCSKNCDYERRRSILNHLRTNMTSCI
jgi:hypothetical protein